MLLLQAAAAVERLSVGLPHAPAEEHHKMGRTKSNPLLLANKKKRVSEETWVGGETWEQRAPSPVRSSRSSLLFSRHCFCYKSGTGDPALQK